MNTVLVTGGTPSQFANDARFHPLVPQPLKRVIAVSQVGFDDGARKWAFEIEAAEGIEVRLETPETMLKLEE